MESIKVKAGDEVCMLVGDELMFGTAEFLKPVVSSSGVGDEGRMWKVKWIHDPSQTISSEVAESKLMPTDRTVEKGSRVRMVVRDGEGIVKEGICRSVMHRADLRILGTNTIIPFVNMEEFTHLKRYTQKSVVHYNGWLGVVLSVDRTVRLRQSDDTESILSLNTVIPAGPLKLESHWINEQVDNVTRPTATQKPPASGGKDPTTDYQIWKKARRLGFVKDLEVEAVKINWIHQIDPNFPDKPKQSFEKNSVNKLQIIKEHVSVDDDGFSFDVGNIGRYTITSQTEFLRWDDWQRKFAAKHLPPEVQNKMQTALGYETNMKSKYWRVYDYNLMSKDEQNKGGDGLKLGQELVVEISHIYTIADIVWKDNTFEIPRSSLDLQVLEDSLTDAEVPRPGDFITSKLLPYKADTAYCVVLKQEQDNQGAAQLVVKVVDCHVPAKIIEEQVIIKGDLLLSAGFVERHPTFQYFNESTTIVVVNEEGCEGPKIRIGNVVGTNLMGKVNVKFLESGGKNYKEAWVWPQTCAIYSVKGYDLECVTSHVTDTDTEIEAETKLRNIIEQLENKVEIVWKNSSKSEQDLRLSMTELTFIIGSLRNLVARIKFPQPLTDEHFEALQDYLNKPIGVDSGRPSYCKENPELASLVLAATADYVDQAQKILGTIESYATQDVEMVDVSDVAQQPVDPLCQIFADTVRVLDSHNEGHHFAKTTKYNPAHNKMFTKTVKQELERLKKICCTQTKSQMGILSRVFADRMDLLTFLMRGPEGTPYEDSLYIFDAHLPPQYPNEPPLFHFHAFSAGRLNPNLYAEGKVCVSLLGTWPGKDQREKWTKDSNLVQILISIQGLILVAEPFHNEPGYETEKYDANSGRVECHRYNIDLMPKIVKMMTAQIEFGMEPWTEIIHSFYMEQVPLFVARWKRWLAAKSETELGNDAPRFALFPISSAFKEVMLKSLNSLEKVRATKSRRANSSLSCAP